MSTDTITIEQHAAPSKPKAVSEPAPSSWRCSAFAIGHDRAEPANPAGQTSAAVHIELVTTEPPHIRRSYANSDCDRLIKQKFADEIERLSRLAALDAPHRQTLEELTAQETALKQERELLLRRAPVDLQSQVAGIDGKLADVAIRKAAPQAALDSTLSAKRAVLSELRERAKHGGLRSVHGFQREKVQARLEEIRQEVSQRTGGLLDEFLLLTRRRLEIDSAENANPDVAIDRILHDLQLPISA